MKICFLADCNHPNTLNWARYLAKVLGHEVHIISFNRPIEHDPSLKVQTLGVSRNNKLKYLFSTQEVREKVWDLKPDILIGYRLTSYAYLAARADYRPLVVAAQSQKAGAWRWGLRKPIQSLTARYAVKKADLILAWAKHMENDIVALGGKREKILTIPRGVKLDMFPYKHRRRSDNSFVLVATRALVKEYDFDVAIKSVARLKGRIPGIRLRLVGDGPHRPQLEALARNLEMASQVEFKGKIPYEDLHSQLDLADLYVSPVPEDGVSSSLLEAMASGLPTLVTDIPANQIWQEYGCHITFFTPRSVKSMVHGILECYANYDKLSPLLSDNLRILKKRACWEKNMKIIERALLNLSN